MLLLPLWNLRRLRREVQEQLTNVQHIEATGDSFGGAFAAVLDSGGLVTWGGPERGGDSSQVQEQLRNVVILNTAEAAAR